MNILQIDSSILGAHSASRTITGAVVRKLQSTPGAKLTYRDLAAEDIGHATAATLPSAHPLSQTAGPLEGEAAAARAKSDAMLEEFLAADVVVIGAPMYNFTIPSQLKAWLDRIVVPGKTFSYGEQGPQGLAGGKRVIIVATRGGFYGTGSPGAAAEHGDSYLRATLGFIGITDPEIIIAEGLAVSETQKAQSLEQAQAVVEALAA